MFGKKKPENAPAAATGEQAAPADKKAEAPKDKPRPFSIFRHEHEKTVAVQKQSAEERKTVDDRLNGLNRNYKPALETYGKELKAAGAERIRVRKETVENLTNEVSDTKQAIAALEKKLAEERAKLARSASALSVASKELKNESGKIEKENKAAYKAKRKELSGEISAARKERSAVYSRTGRTLRHEKWNTFKRTTHESAAVVPDMTVRFFNAARRSIAGVFSNAKKGFDEPTLFSVKRDEPLKKPPQAKPPAPAQ